MDRWFRGFSAILLGLVALLGATTPAAADSGLAGRTFPVCFRVGPGNAAALLARPSTFDCTTPQKNIVGNGEFWAISPPLAKYWSPERSLLRFGSVWQDHVSIYVLYADGAVVPIALDAHEITRRIHLGATIEVALPVRAAPVDRLMFHIKGSANYSGILLGTRLATPSESNGAEFVIGLFYAGFAGLCIALLIYNLALWAALRHRFQLTYCAMLFSLLGYVFSSSGALAWAWPDISNNARLGCNYVLLASAAAGALLFARDFFERRVFAGWLSVVTKAIVVTLLGSSIAIATLGPLHVGWMVDINSGAYIALLAIVGPILWRAWRRRSNYLWIFAIAWAAPVLFAGLRIGQSVRLIGWSFWIDNSTPIAMAIEALLSSIAIAYRMRLLSRERDEARRAEVAAHILANTDPLTELLNRRAFLSQAIGREGDQTLVLIDIDHFKQINEAIGHDGGDDVLRALGRCLEAGMTAPALVARLGGEEFGILVPAETPINPDLILDRIRRMPTPFDVTVTASAGLCTGPLETDRDWKRLYRLADRALYAAKAAGRDRVRRADPPALAA